MGPAQRHVLSPEVDGVAKAGKGGIGQSRVLDAGLAKDVVAKELVLRTNAVVKANGELIIVAHSGFLVHEVRNAGPVGCGERAQRQDLGGSRIDASNDVTRNRVAYEG